MSKTKSVWVHDGGGTYLAGGKYPSDDSYQNTKTKEVITIQCTTGAHFSMPEKVNRCSDLLKIPGVDKRSLRTLGVQAANGDYKKKSYLRGVKFFK